MFAEYSRLDDDEFFEWGHDPYDMTPFCMFRGQSCELEDFAVFRDTQYGTCVSFNSGRSIDYYYDEIYTNVSLKKSTNTGPHHGKRFRVVF